MTAVNTAATWQAVYNEPGDTIPAYTRHGARVTVVVNSQLVWGKTVWQRGVWLPRPFYAWRLRRAQATAHRILAATR